MRNTALLILCFMSLAFFGCPPYQTTQQATKESALTPGMTKKYIKPGKTSQTEVLEIFGPPDLITRKSGNEVWTYDKISQDFSTNGGYLTVIFAGTRGQRATQTNRSVMLIIYFTEDEIVYDYKLSVARF